MLIKNLHFSSGQTLIELIVVIAMTILVTGALTFATIASLRNADLAKNQAQATILAQEGLEQVRTVRDQNGVIDYDDRTTNPNHRHTIFSDLWDLNFDCGNNQGGGNQSSDNCYFNFLNNKLTGWPAVGIISFEPIHGGIQQPGGFQRQIRIEDDSANSKKVTSIVQWKDFSGTHESRLTTILGKN